MKNIIIPVILFSIVAYRCNKDDNFCDPEIISNNLSANRVIAIDTLNDGDSVSYSFEVVIGDNIVAFHSITPMHCLEDSTFYINHIIFEIDPSADSIAFIDSALLDIKCFYTISNYAPFAPEVAVTEGTISGEKVFGDQWNIQINVMVNDPVSNSKINISDSGIYSFF